MVPKIIKGGNYSDSRGILSFNNDFDASEVKRIYIIENQSIEILRAWQGHKIERRWFSVVKGSFKIQLIAVDNWDMPTKKIDRLSYILHSETLDVLQVPAGYVCSIQSLEVGGKLLVMSDYFLGEIKDEYRYAIDYFE